MKFLEDMVKTIFFYTAMMLTLAITAGGCNDPVGSVKTDELDLWFPIGAVWCYGGHYSGSYYPDYPDFIVEKDTVVGGKKCRIVRSEYSKDIVYEENGRVYYYFQNQFRKIYDFNVKAGDVVEFEFKTTDTDDINNLNTIIVLPFLIESVTAKVIDSVALREVSALYTGDDFEYRHTYLEKVGIECKYDDNKIMDGIFSVCPERVAIKVTHLYSYKDHAIEYFPNYWVVGLKLKPQFGGDYLATEDPIIKALEMKYSVELKRTYPSTWKDPEFSLFYDLRCYTGGGRKTVLRDFFATGKFDETYLYDPPLAQIQ